MVLFFFLILFLSLYGGLSYYVGLRAWHWLLSVAPLPLPYSGWVYWSLFWLLALSFFLGRLASGRAPKLVTGVLTNVGAYWLGVLSYGVLWLALVDLFRLLNRWTGIIPARLVANLSLTRYGGAMVCLVLLAALLYGTWRARTPVVTEYTLSIPKSAGQYRELHVVLVSDIHLGYIIGNSRLRQLTRMVGGLHPDLILIPGDIIDNDYRPFVADGMAAELGKLKSPLGTYACPGNHDLGPEGLPGFRAQMQRAGIRLLADEWVKVDDSLVIAGRKDHASPRPSNPITPLDEIMQGVDRSLPILLLDHNPNRLGDAVAAGVDLQVSGHTHRGQMFPFNFATRRVFEVDWGYLKKGATHFVVSLGFGTWGPPIRIGNRPEVVRIRLSFGGQ
ncbi:MAG: metallophosphoesterase [Symbiobacteriia bacterium]